jgi:hypothetical protein
MLHALLLGLAVSAPPAHDVSVVAPANDVEAPRRRAVWALEIGTGIPYTQPARRDGYTRRLEGFDFERPEPMIDDTRFLFTLGALWELHENLSLGLRIDRLEHESYQRVAPLTSYDEATYDFDWSTYALALSVRAGARVRTHSSFWVEAGAGPAFASSTYHSEAKDAVVGFTPEHEDETQWGWQYGLGLGASLNFNRFVGVFVRVAWHRAPVLANLVGDTHESGGVVAFLGMRAGS